MRSFLYLSRLEFYSISLDLENFENQVVRGRKQRKWKLKENWASLFMKESERQRQKREWIDYFDAMRWLKKTFLFTIPPNKRNMRDNRSDSFFWWGLDHSRMMTMSIMQMRIFTLSRSAFQWILAGAQENILQLKSRGGWRVERKRKGRADERVSRKSVSEEGGREEMNSWQGQR